MCVCVRARLSLSLMCCVSIFITYTLTLTLTLSLSLSLDRSLAQIGSYGFFELAWTLEDEQYNTCSKCGCGGEYFLLISRDVSDPTIADVRGSVTVLDSLYQHYPDNKQVPYTQVS